MKVLKDSFIYLIGELFAKSLPFLMLPYLTRKLGPEGFGELSYYLTWLALFGIFVGLSQEGAVTRYYYFYGKRSLNTIIKAGYLFNIFISVLLLIGCWILQAEIMIYIVLATMFQSFISVQLALKQCQKQPLKYIAIQVILSLSNVLFTITVLEVVFQDLVVHRILAIMAANIFTFIVASIILGNLIRDKSKITYKRLELGLVYVVSFGLPLVFHQASFFIKGQLDRVFIYEQYSKFELGVYSAGVQLAAVLPIVLMALNKGILPYYYSKLKDGTLTVKEIKNYILFSIPICLIPAIIGGLIPDNLYAWFLGDQYVTSKYYTVMYLLGFSMNLPYLLAVNYFFFHAKNIFISKVTFFSSIIYLFLLIVFSNIDIIYVPIALVVSNFFMIIFFYVNLKVFKKNEV